MYDIFNSFGYFNPDAYLAYLFHLHSIDKFDEKKNDELLISLNDIMDMLEGEGAITGMTISGLVLYWSRSACAAVIAFKLFILHLNK
jgi:tmRNA-binding protein